MNGLTQMIRIEIVISGRDAPPIRDLITSAGATGYTSVSGVSDTLTMLITVLPPDRAPALIDAVRQLLEAGSGVMFVAETHVSRPEYFQ